MQAVFDAPVAADVGQQSRCVVGRQVGDVVAELLGRLLADGPLGMDADEASQVLPLVPLGEPSDLRCRPDAAFFDSSMVAVSRRSG